MVRKALIITALFFLLISLFPVAAPSQAATAVGVSPPSGRVGDKARFTGTVSFQGNRYELYWDTMSPATLLVAAATVTTGVSAEFTVPEAVRGPHIIIMRDIDDGTQAQATFEVLPSITITPATGGVGTAITVNGFGFSAGEGGIRVTFDGVDAATAPNANAKGSWTTTLPIPPAAKGTHTIGAATAQTAVADIPALGFTITPQLTLNPTAAAVGASLTVSGSGYAQNEPGISVTIDGVVVKSGLTADAKGSWSFPYVVPPGTSRGSHTVGASGSATPSSEVGTYTFSLAGGIRIQPDSGIPGTTVNISGFGFGPNEKDIQVTFDGAPVKQEITADGNGNWSSSFVVPPRPKGRRSVRAFGAVTAGGDIAPATFTISPRVSSEPASGVIGTEITVRGQGFDANKDISVTYDDKLIAEGTTNAEGNFTARFKAPAGKGGAHAIVVKDPTGGTMQLSFSMDSEPPAVPQPQSPENKTRLSMFGGVVTSFEWTESKDPSGVTYELQLSKTPDFAKPVINKTGLTDLFYNMIPRETLDIGTYYWRVRAIDGAGNASPWCPAQELIIGIMPVWQFILIIVGSIAVIVGIVVWLMRRRMYDF